MSKKITPSIKLHHILFTLNNSHKSHRKIFLNSLIVQTSLPYQLLKTEKTETITKRKQAMQSQYHTLVLTLIIPKITFLPVKHHN